ncbi:hypothetical protein SAMN02745121_06560 [Nannocystis exedens]|uniref:Uncharacterized protein n=1 Tax=Nannocystis exedens TaxID=54 RepID=A0A1I2FDG4_9BACT|nr:hypothetical protein [Nannocystis exedens]PCC70521.1 hypothetical protein NAEX_03585 [Nannocystis exedens]SFF02929.1 hypothetical protein SAMN02745121_06560 [Nannocystis exedens]
MSVLLSLLLCLAPAGSDDWPRPPSRSAPPSAAPAAVETATPADPAPAAAHPRPKRRCADKKGRCDRRPSRGKRNPPIDPRLVEAAARRDQLLTVSASMVAAGRTTDAAEMVRGAAEALGDPVLYLAAADLQLADGRARIRHIDAAVALADRARKAALAPEQALLPADAVPRLVDLADQLGRHAEQRRERLQLQRRGRAELAAGSAFLGLGLAGVALIASGAALAARVDAAQAADPATDPAYSAALAERRDGAEAMLAVGLVGGLAGLAIGIPLTVAGARDHKRSRAGESEAPHLRIAPGFAGLTVSGRF